MNIYIGKWSTSPSLRDWSNNKFSYIYSTLLATYISKCKISYNTLTSELKFHMVFSVFIDDVVKKESRQFLLNCSYAILVGVHLASATSNLKKGVNTNIWMELNTNDDTKIKLWILLLTHLILFFRVAPLTGRVADELANVVSTVIIPGFLQQPLYKK